MASTVFTVADYAFLVGTLLFSALIGVYYAVFKKQKTSEDVLMGGRNMSVFPVACSLMATYLSSVTVMGTPSEVYNHGGIILLMLPLIIITGGAGIYIFLPTLYKLHLTSVYEYFELRYDTPLVRCLASGSFMMQMTLFMGVVLYAPSLALQTFVGFPIWASILVLGGVATLYTTIGGLRAVVWTDVFQSCITFLGLIAIVVKSSINVGGLGEIFRIAYDNGRLDFTDLRLDIFVRHTIWNILVGYGYFIFIVMATGQPACQRYGSLGTLKEAYRCMIWAPIMFTVCFGLAQVTGLAVFANFAECDPLAQGQITLGDEIVPHFVAEELGMVQGMVGLFLSCLLSAALSTLSSGLNSLAAVTWEDFLSRAGYFHRMSPEAKGLVSKLLSLFYGVIAVGFAFMCGSLGSIFTLTMTISGALGGGIATLFLFGFFVPFSNKWGAMAGLLSSHFITLWIGLGAATTPGIPKIEDLPFRLDGCPPVTLDPMENSTLTELYQYSTVSSTSTAATEEDMNWLHQLYSISYVYYSFIAFLVIMSVGTTVSLITGPAPFPEDKEHLMHPWVTKLRNFSRRKRESGTTYEPVKVTIFESSNKISASYSVPEKA